jgi:hypothetical protein
MGGGTGHAAGATGFSALRDLPVSWAEDDSYKLPLRGAGQLVHCTD